MLESGSWRARRSAVPTEEPPALRWAPHRTLRERLRRAVSVPVLAGGAVLVAAVIGAIVMVALQPHGIGGLGEHAASPGSSAASSRGSSAASGSDDASGGASGGASGEDSARASGGARGGASGKEIVIVHVVGEVASPGVVEVPGGSRVADAIEAAGGATPAAVLASVNLARQVVDGEQIVVPDAAGAALPQAGGAQPGGSGSPSADAAGGTVNLNAADAAALESLPRVGPALAARIIEWREANGGFSSVEQLLEVPGIGAKTLQGFRDRVTV